MLQTIHMSETCTADMSSYFDDFHDVIGIPATPMCQGDFRRRRQDSPPPIPEAPTEEEPDGGVEPPRWCPMVS